MKQANFVAHCPFEIGDRVEAFAQKFTIDDIITEHSAKNGTVNFKAVLKTDEGLFTSPMSIDLMTRAGEPQKKEDSESFCKGKGFNCPSCKDKDGCKDYME